MRSLFLRPLSYPMPEHQPHTESEQVLGYLIGGLAHDLNNYLSPILLGVQTLQRNDPDEKTKRILSMIEQSSRRATEMLRHILDHARSTRIGSERTSSSQVAEMLEQCVREQQSTDYDFEVQYDPLLAHREMGIGYARLYLILQALLRNAWEATVDRPFVRVSCRACTIDDEYRRLHRSARVGNFACIEVKDLGCGMTDEVLKHACDAFYTTRQHSGHAGLGLFLVHTLVKQSDGFIEFDTSADKGTSVRVYVPLMQGSAEMQNNSR